ncbi:hypothetical protein [Geminocystis herdmanii]|uniref:hypothetical protein n=1 Tax=Geminocystis herdmanii TaxID=669359 RepID=UPI00034AC444|nr:hypothetical protein [Geminocystis herdmanii]
MNKFTFTLHNLSPRIGLLSLGIMGLWISPMLTLNAFASIEISIDPYNDSGFNSTPVMTQPLPIKNNSPSPVTNSPQLPPTNSQPLPTGNQNNVIGEVFINGNPTPNRPEVVSGNVIKSNQSLPQIPPLSEPYRSPNNNPTPADNETIESNNPVLSVSSVSPFDETPTDNQSTVEKKPLNNSHTMRSIDLSPNSPPSPLNKVVTPSVSPTTETSIPSITSPNTLGRRRSLNDILVLSNPSANPPNPANSSPTMASSSSTTQNVYKVLVGVTNASQESQVKYLYPEAFRTVFNGQSMLQVGVFSTVNNADDVARSLQSRGFKTEITN